MEARGRRAAEEAAYDVLENLLEGCQIVDREFRYVYVNAAVAQHGRRTRQELLGRTMMECYPGIDTTPMFAELRRCMTDREHVLFENRFTYPDGTEGVFRLRFVPVPAGVCVLSEDITASVEANERSRQGESAFRGVFAANPEASILVGEDGSVIAANRAAEGLFGGSLDGTRVDDLVPEARRAAHAAHRQAFHEAPRVRRMSDDARLEARRLDGIRIPVDVSLGPVDFFGKPAALAIIRDLTETLRLEASVKSLEQQTRQLQKMEAVGRLAGGIAHDFNNLLSVILSYTSLLSDSLAGDPLQEDLRQIETAAIRASELTAQILTFSRQEVPAPPQATVLDGVLSSLQKMLARLLGEDVEVVLRLGSAPHAVLLEQGRIEQVVMNLAVNARDAMPLGGRLLLETERVELDEVYAAQHLGTKPGSHVMLAVTDNGIGMDAATRERIFEPFFTTKEVGRGTGLGLSTVYAIVRQAGGSVWVYSEPGVGTTFKIFLPIVSLDAYTAPPPVRRQARAPQRELLLVAEDDEQVRAILCSTLERAGYEVLEAPNPDVALQLSARARRPVDLLVSDLVMPRMGGRELAARVRSRWPDARVLFVSGYTGAAAKESGQLEVAAEFLEKPITPTKLLDKVADVLGGPSTG